MTEKQVKDLKAGDIVRDVGTGKEYTLSNFTLGNINGKTTIMIEIDLHGTSNIIGLPFYANELELVSLTKAGQCTCDFYKVILVTGCKCGGG